MILLSGSGWYRHRALVKHARCVMRRFGSRTRRATCAGGARTALARVCISSGGFLSFVGVIQSADIKNEMYSCNKLYKVYGFKV